MNITTPLTLIAALSLSTAAFAQDRAEPTLAVGDKAPALDISHWLKMNDTSKNAEPVTTFAADTIYVVEFWATWCGPCLQAMPHIAELQEQYRDYNVEVIGISDEPLQKVVGFLAQDHPQMDDQTWFDVLSYNLATDPDRSVYTDYMTAAGYTGIPRAFIVGRDGVIEWTGHPMSMDEPLEQIVKDTWDRDAYLRTEKMKQQIHRSMRAGEVDTALRQIDEVLTTDEHNAELLNMKFYILSGEGRYDEAYTAADAYITARWEDPSALNAISWYILDDASMKERNTKIAMRAAKRASELTEHKDAAILDTYARAFYEQGDLQEAITWQRKAVKAAEHPGMKRDLETALLKYEKEAK